MFFFPMMGRAGGRKNLLNTVAKESVPLHIPKDIWQPLVEIRSELDASCPGAPTPIEEALREIINHYKHCSATQDELEAFCRRAQAWKGKAIQ